MEILSPLGMPAVIVPRPFVLAEQDSGDLAKLRSECLDKVHASEDDLENFHNASQEYADSWRVNQRKVNASKPRGRSNDKSGETHRGTETLATMFFRMLTAHDHYYSAISEGLDPGGMEIDEAQLYGTESLLRKQQQELNFKFDFYRGLVSCALFGTVIYELTWKQTKDLAGNVFFEGTQTRLRPLITCGFDTSVSDIEDSDYFYTVDFPTIWRLRGWASSDPDTWDRGSLFKELENPDYLKDVNGGGSESQAMNRIIQRRNRAGYNMLSPNIRELINYYGRLDTENSVIQRYWESLGLKSNPADYDFNLGLMNSSVPVKFCHAPYGNWRSKYKIGHYKPFELEPLGYGVGSIGKVKQRELDLVGSRANDILRMSLDNVWLADRQANLKQNQLTLRPNSIVEVDGVDNVKPLRPDMNSIVQALQMMAISREEFRNNVGAASQLQAILTKATATESSIAQNESLRGAGVHAELLGEVLRSIFKQHHINNYFHLDAEIWVNVTGKNKPVPIDKYSLPYNIGFIIKVTTDKDFRPERNQKLLEAIQILSSVRNDFPEMNALRPLIEELFRGFGLNPARLNEPIPIKDQIMANLKNAQKLGLAPGVGNEVEGEAAGLLAGGGGNVSGAYGDVPNSPVSEAA